MKTLIIQVLFLLSLGLIIPTQAQDFTTAGQYKDFILAEKAKVLNKKLAYIAKAHYNNGDNHTDATRQLVIEQIEKSMIALKQLPAFNGDSKLKDETVALLQSYKEIYHVDFKEVDSLAFYSSLSHEDMEVYFKALEKAERKLTNAGKKFARVHEGFDKKNNLPVVAEKEYDWFAKMSQVNSHCRKVYLPYFKITKVHAEFLEALKHKKLSEMAKNRELLLATAHEVIEVLQKVEHLNGDKVYLEKGLELANHFKNLAVNQYAKLIELTDKKFADHSDAMTFNKTIIDSHRQTKKLTHSFNQAGASLMQKNVLNQVYSSTLTASADEKKTTREIIKASVNLIGEEVAKSLDKSNKTKTTQELHTINNSNSSTQPKE